MVSDSFHDGGCAGIAYGESFAGAAGHEQRAGCRAVEQRISGDGVFRSVEMGVRIGTYDDAATGKALAQIVVRFSFKPEADSLHKEGAETLSGRPVESDVHRPVGQTILAVAFRYAAGQQGADGTVGVSDAIVQRYAAAFFQCWFCCSKYMLVQDVSKTVPVLGICVEVTVSFLEKETAEIQRCRLRAGLCTVHGDKVRTPDDIFESAESHLGQILANFLGQETIVVDQCIAASAV